MPNAVLDNKKSGCGATLAVNMLFVKHLFCVPLLLLMGNGKYYTRE
jgi:hypothetical protein